MGQDAVSFFLASRYCACKGARANRDSKGLPERASPLGEMPHLVCGAAFAKRMPAHRGRRAARSAQAPRPRPCEPRAAQCSTRRRRLNRPAVQASQSASIGLERSSRGDRGSVQIAAAEALARPKGSRLDPVRVTKSQAFGRIYPAGLARCKTHAPNAANR